MSDTKGKVLDHVPESGRVIVVTTGFRVLAPARPAARAAPSASVANLTREQAKALHACVRGAFRAHHGPIDKRSHRDAQALDAVGREIANLLNPLRRGYDGLAVISRYLGLAWAFVRGVPFMRVEPMHRYQLAPWWHPDPGTTQNRVRVSACGFEYRMFHADVPDYAVGLRIIEHNPPQPRTLQGVLAKLYERAELPVPATLDADVVTWIGEPSDAAIRIAAWKLLAPRLLAAKRSR